ncbi:hypothetical protein F0P96_09660 [Hymenobacter busanensis]|uniref:Uncharacterized protein n=1 Tax=Hymenobacter busanensis TaxID=2607656 RepID=A0A7L4ZX54_9BACT|nr:hypothetical protein [Hymenobacter busanensis]KAA9333234.1 hypothetical protein F0P96_09660 [Hymenobacter busanensis]QHJ08089.1 hypothetical protein GUY19_12660 [Hymenobacter busanensis]
MDDLRTTLGTFSPDDRKEFLRFLQRQRRKEKGRKDANLCELLWHKRELSTEALLARLYPEEPNPVAYYALRKRLLRQVTDFLLLKQRDQDPTAASTVRGQLSLAQHLFEAGVPRLAWATLRKAEKLAAQNEQYELLNTVYNLQIEHAHSEHAEPIDDIIRRRNRNKPAAEEEERAAIAYSLMRQRLKLARTQGRSVTSFDEIMQDVLREYDLQEAFARRPSLLYRLLSIARSAMLVRRDFASFEPFVRRCYHLMEKRHGFAPAQRAYQLGLLYMIAHALYRNRRFTESVAYLEQLRGLLANGARSLQAEFYPKYIFLLAANNAFLHRNAESIQLLEELLRTQTLNPRDQLTAQLGLGFHYFAEGKYQRTNHTLQAIGRTDHWCEEKMGVEWLLNKNMGELLTQLEMGNADVAGHRLRAIDRLVRDRFGPDGGSYRYVLSYLALVRELIENPDAAARPEFAQSVAQMPRFLPLEREDLQALSFYAWLKARAVGRPYYQVLLELAETPPVLVKTPA